VVIPGDGRPRVVDFGLAKIIGVPEAVRPSGLDRPKPDPEPPADVQSDSTTSGGTPAYMAPEQWYGEECSPKTDVWALGVMLFELCSGELPFMANTPVKLYTRVCSPDTAPRIDECADVPVELADLIASCLDKKAEQRPSAADVAEALSEMLHGVTGSMKEQVSPFRGLLPFTERYAGLYFGREAEVAAAVERLRLQAVLAIMGPSGAGKSSFVQAGLIPRLREQEEWIVLQLRPGSRPFEALATRLQRRETLASRSSAQADRTSDFEADEHISVDEGDVASFGERLKRSPGRLSLELRAIAEEQNAKVLLFVDQLEELFTLVDDEPIRRSFMQAICMAADDPLEPVRVVLAARDDFLGRLATGFEAREALSHIMVIQQLEPDSLEQVLQRPVAAVGYRFEDDELVREMVTSVRGEPACLPLLQFAAQMLWERADKSRRVLLRSGYEAMGGVAGALAKHADGILHSLSPAEQKLARELLLRLVTAQKTRKVIPRSKALESLGPQASDVLTRLTDARLVTVSKSYDRLETTAMLELAHESLIVTWKTLAQWLDESEDELAFLAQVGQAAELWQQRGQPTDEVWQGEALRDGLRSLASCTATVPEQISRFLAAGRRKEKLKLRRRRGLVSGVIAALAIVAVVLAAQNREASFQRVRAEQKQTEALQQRGEALREGARAALGRGELLEARAKLRGSLETQDSSLGRALWWQLRRDPLYWHKDIGAYAYKVAFSPDSQTLAVAAGDKAVHLYDVKTRMERLLRGHRDQVCATAISPNGRYVASGSEAGELRLWDLASGRLEHVFKGHAKAVRDVAFSPDSRLLASASFDRSVRLWNVAERQPARVLKGHTGWVFSLSFAPDGMLLASAGGDKAIWLWDVSTGTTRRVIRGHSKPVPFWSVDFSPDGQSLVTTGRDGGLRLWNVASGEQRKIITGDTRVFRDARFSPDGRSLAVASHDGTVRLWDLDSGQPSQKLEGHASQVWSVDFSPDGRLLATVSVDQNIRLWALRSQVPRASRGQHGRIGPHSAAVAGVALSPDGQLIASASHDQTIRLWDFASGTPQRVLSGHRAPIADVSFSPDGKTLASASYDKTVRLWEVASGTERQLLEGHTAGVWAVSFSPDGSLLASASSDRSVRLWNATSGVLLRQLDGHDRAVYALSFSPDGRQLASACADRTIGLWDTATGELQQRLEAHSGMVYGVSFGPDGRQFASAGTDGEARLWDLESGQSRLIGNCNGRAYWLDFHPDGTRVGVPCSDHTSRIWSTASDSPVVLRGHRDEVAYLRFSPDGRWALTTSDDTTVRLWDAANGNPFWRAPVMLHSPIQLFSHRGWTRLQGSGAAPPATKWRKAIENRAAFGSQSPDGALLCLRTQGSELELWDVAADARLAVKPVAGLQQVWALPEGCVLIASDKAQLMSRSGELNELPVPAKATALSWDGRQILVAAGGKIWALSASGTVLATHGADVGITAIHRADSRLLAGYADGSIEPVGTAPRGNEPTVAYDRPSTNPVVRMISGPGGTLIAGYANGLLGIWDHDTGTLLNQIRLHGPVVHLLLKADELYAATELGQHAVWDLSVFHIDYCQLLREVWNAVPVVWSHSRAVLRQPPPDHSCARAGKQP